MKDFCLCTAWAVYHTVNARAHLIKYKFDDFEEFDRFRLKYEDLKYEDLIDVRTAFDYKGDNAIGKMIGDMWANWKEMRNES